MSKSLINFAAFAVLFNNGTIDREATIKKFEVELDEHTANSVELNRIISRAVHGWFDENKGDKINLPDLAYACCFRLNVDAKEVKEYTKLISDYVRANSGDVDSGKVFGIVKGRHAKDSEGGSTRRWCDYVEPLKAAAKKSK